LNEIESVYRLLSVLSSGAFDGRHFFTDPGKNLIGSGMRVVFLDLFQDDHALRGHAKFIFVLQRKLLINNAYFFLGAFAALE